MGDRSRKSSPRPSRRTSRRQSGTVRVNPFCFADGNGSPTVIRRSASKRRMRNTSASTVERPYSKRSNSTGPERSICFSPPPACSSHSTPTMVSGQHADCEALFDCGVSPPLRSNESRLARFKESVDVLTDSQAGTLISREFYLTGRRTHPAAYAKAVSQSIERDARLLGR